MIHGFKGKCVTTAEEWLIDYSLKNGNAVNVNPDLLEMPIKFDSKEVDAFILDVIDNKLVIHLAFPLKCKFDDKSNRYETSYVRKLINSNKFLNRFNPEFVKHIQLTEVHTEDYTTKDKLWLLSHEEISQDVAFLKPNGKCTAFEMFKTIDLEAYSQIVLKDAYGWRLRSAGSYTNYVSDSSYVGIADYYGNVDYSSAYYTDYGALLPACTIC